MKYTTDFNEFLNESAKSDKLAPLFVQAIEKVDESLSYIDLAAAVAKILNEEYGTHNIKPFMKELHKQLGLKESIDEMAKSDVHYQEIIAMYNSGSFAKKKVGAVVCKNPKASLKEIEEVLGDAGYEEMIEFIDDLGIKESKDSDTFVGNPGEDKRMVDIRAFRGSVKDLTDFIDDKVEKSSK
jgi:hypothetical protein